jgi:ribose/xylose/arabinose/galactoside ABC-type transport system permease subunit
VNLVLAILAIVLAYLAGCVAGLLVAWLYARSLVRRYSEGTMLYARSLARRYLEGATPVYDPDDLRGLGDVEWLPPQAPLDTEARGW